MNKRHQCTSDTESRWLPCHIPVPFTCTSSWADSVACCCCWSTSWVDALSTDVVTSSLKLSPSSSPPATSPFTNDELRTFQHQTIRTCLVYYLYVFCQGATKSAYVCEWFELQLPLQMMYWVRCRFSHRLVLQTKFQTFRAREMGPVVWPKCQ